VSDHPSRIHRVCSGVLTQPPSRLCAADSVHVRVRVRMHAYVRTFLARFFFTLGACSASAPRFLSAVFFAGGASNFASAAARFEGVAIALE
jgi:hypothetical protein